MLAIYANGGTPMTALFPFHLAFPVHDLTAARAFYGALLGCREGRSSADWVDFDFFGHQIVAHLDPQGTVTVPANGVDFVIEPYVRFKGEPGEQATMFFKDPSGNALELKAFADIGELFAK